MTKYNILCQIVSIVEAYTEPRPTLKMELLAENINGFEPLTIFTKSSNLDAWLGSECTFVLFEQISKNRDCYMKVFRTV